MYRYGILSEIDKLNELNGNTLCHYETNQEVQIYYPALLLPILLFRPPSHPSTPPSFFSSPCPALLHPPAPPSVFPSLYPALLLLIPPTLTTLRGERVKENLFELLILSINEVKIHISRIAEI